MAGKVLSIEVGQSFTRVIETDYKSSRKPRIYKYLSFLTPEGTITDDVINEEQIDDFVSLLKAELKENHITTTKVIFTVSSGSIASREVMIPLVKENKIQGILAVNSSEYFPVDLSRYQLAYRMIGKDEKSRQMKLLAFAVPKRMVESYYALAKACNLTVLSMDYVGNSIFHVMQSTMGAELAVSIKVEETSSLITIVKNGEVDLQRSIGYGIDEIVECVKDSGCFGTGLTYEEGIEILGRENCIHKTLAGISEEERAEAMERGTSAELLELRDNATEAVRYLIGNLTRALDYYTSRNGNVQIKEITLLGIGAYCKGVDELLANELGTKVTTVTAFADARPTGKAGAREFRAAEFMACIGAAINPLEITLEATKKSGKQGEASESMLAPNIVFAVGFIAAILLVAIPLIQNFSLNKEKRELENRLAELQPAQEVFDAYQLAQADYLDALAMDELADTENDALLDFLEEFEEKCPSNILLDNLSAGTTGVTLTVKADKKEEIAELITQMREFGTVGSVETSGFSEEQDDEGILKINATIICTYAMPDDTAETDESTDSTAADETADEKIDGTAADESTEQAEDTAAGE